MHSAASWLLSWVRTPRFPRKATRMRVPVWYLGCFCSLSWFAFCGWRESTKERPSPWCEPGFLPTPAPRVNGAAGCGAGAPAPGRPSAFEVAYGCVFFLFFPGCVCVWGFTGKLKARLVCVFFFLGGGVPRDTQQENHHFGGAPYKRQEWRGKVILPLPGNPKVLK